MSDQLSCRTAIRAPERIVLVALLALVSPTIGAAATLSSANAAMTAVVPCDSIIDRAKTVPAGYRVVLDLVSVPPAHLTQVVATRSRPWAYWRKAGLAIRASRTPVTVTVPQAWRMRAAITWGTGGITSSLRFNACPSPRNVWNAYAGGFYLRSRSACVPLTFQVSKRSTTVRFGIGQSC